MYLFCINEHLRFTDFQYNSTKIWATTYHFVAIFLITIDYIKY